MAIFAPDERLPSSATLLPTLSKFLPSINVDIIKTFQAVAGLFFRRENEPRGVQDSPVSKTEFCVIVSQTGDDGLSDFTKLYFPKSLQCQWPLSQPYPRTQCQPDRVFHI